MTIIRTTLTFFLLILLGLGWANGGRSVILNVLKEDKDDECILLTDLQGGTLGQEDSDGNGFIDRLFATETLSILEDDDDCLIEVQTSVYSGSPEDDLSTYSCTLEPLDRDPDLDRCDDDDDEDIQAFNLHVEIADLEDGVLAAGQYEITCTITLTAFDDD